MAKRQNQELVVPYQLYEQTREVKEREQDAEKQFFYTVDYLQQIDESMKEIQVKVRNLVPVSVKDPITLNYLDVSVGGEPTTLVLSTLAKTQLISTIGNMSMSMWNRHAYNDVYIKLNGTEVPVSVGNVLLRSIFKRKARTIRMAREYTDNEGRRIIGGLVSANAPKFKFGQFMEIGLRVIKDVFNMEPEYQAPYISDYGTVKMKMFLQDISTARSGVKLGVSVQENSFSYGLFKFGIEAYVAKCLNGVVIGYEGGVNFEAKHQNHTSFYGAFINVLNPRKDANGEFLNETEANIPIPLPSTEYEDYAIKIDGTPDNPNYEKLFSDLWRVQLARFQGAVGTLKEEFALAIKNNIRDLSAEIKAWQKRDNSFTIDVAQWVEKTI